MNRILFVGAHPDDETFGPGATLAKYAAEGHDVFVRCATRGEAGMWSDVKPNGRNLGEVREKEHQKAMDVLGIKSVSYLDYSDGTLANRDMESIVEKLSIEVNKLRPDIVITMDLLGLSGHIDHIVMALATTKMFYRHNTIKKLYYYALPNVVTDKISNSSGNHVWGRPMNEITTIINIGEWVNKKIEAARCHGTQQRDVKRLIPFWIGRKVDYFVLGGNRGHFTLPETDLLTGLQ